MLYQYGFIMYNYYSFYLMYWTRYD
jgi:hypothetical protein